MAQEVTVTGKEVLAYAWMAPDRWNKIKGCRIYFWGRGFGIIEPRKGGAEFKIVFEDQKRHWWQFNRRNEITVGLEAFITGRICRVTFSELPVDFIQQFPIEPSRESPQSSEETPHPVVGESKLPAWVLDHQPAAEDSKTRPQSVVAPATEYSKQTEYVYSSRSLEIQAFCKEHRIQRLVHFARADHLNSIIRYGLLSRTAVAQLPYDKRPTVNDIHRVDGQLGSISVSISYPNYRMFYRYRQMNPSVAWAVLTLSVQILWELDCAFCFMNASAHEVSQIPLPERKTYSSLQRMFGDVVNKPRRDLCLPPNYTTDPQAEVLVLETIQPSLITSACFCSSHNLNAWRDKHGMIPNKPEFRVDASLFNPRCDYAHWSSSASAAPWRSGGSLTSVHDSVSVDDIPL